LAVWLGILLVVQFATFAILRISWKSVVDRLILQTVQ
jgi:hypothetical protein